MVKLMKLLKEQHVQVLTRGLQGLMLGNFSTHPDRDTYALVVVNATHPHGVESELGRIVVGESERPQTSLRA